MFDDMYGEAFELDEFYESLLEGTSREKEVKRKREITVKTETFECDDIF